VTGPLWLHAVLASLMIVIAADSAIRLRLVRFARSSWRRRAALDADGLHVLMGVAMAGMLLPRLRILPAPVWETVFALGAIWFGWQAIATRRTGVHWPGSAGRLAVGRLAVGTPFAHVIECLAMMFMLLPVFGDAAGRPHRDGLGMAGMSGGLDGVAPAVALLLALCLVGYVVWTTDGLARTRSAAPAAAATVAGEMMASRLAGFSTIAMTLTMGYMLIQMA
jgi:hypothetical protein